MKRIPWNEISDGNRAKIKSVVSEYSIFHQMPKQTIYSDPEIFNYLLEHPDIVVGMWEKLGATQISLRELGENRYLMKESVGTTAVIDIIYRSPGLYVVYAKGQYKGPLLSRVYEGDTVLILRNRFSSDSQGEPYVVSDLDVFVRIESLGADLLAKLFASSLAKIADSNFEQTISFVSHVSDASTRNPGAVQRIGQELHRVKPDTRDVFSDVVFRVALRAQQREERAHAALFAIQAEVQPAYAAPYEIPKPQDGIWQFSAEQTTEPHTESRLRSEIFTMPTPPSLRPTSTEGVKETVGMEFGPWLSAEPENVPVVQPEPAESHPAKPTGRVIFGVPKIVRTEAP